MQAWTCSRLPRPTAPSEHRRPANGDAGRRCSHAEDAERRWSTGDRGRWTRTEARHRGCAVLGFDATTTQGGVAASADGAPVRTSPLLMSSSGSRGELEAIDESYASTPVTSVVRLALIDEERVEATGMLWRGRRFAAHSKPRLTISRRRENKGGPPSHGRIERCFHQSGRRRRRRSHRPSQSVMMTLSFTGSSLIVSLCGMIMMACN